MRSKPIQLGPMLGATVALHALVAVAADYHAPAVFTIADEVVAANPGRYTATFDDGPVNRWLNAGYEPMAFRRKFHVEGESPDELIVPRSEIDGHNVVKSGLWDGARTRLYRIRGGRLVKIREDRVKRHDASGWNGLDGFPGDRLLPPTATTYQFRVADWSRREAPYYFCVRSVAADGRESEPSNVARVVIPAGRDTTTVLPPEWVAFKADRNAGVPQTIPPPTELQSEVDPTTGIVTLRWNSVVAPAVLVEAVDELEGGDSPAAKAVRGGIVGYRVQVSDYAPEAQHGFRIRLENAPADPALHLKQGDMVFLEKEFRTWVRSERWSNRVYNSHEGGDPGMIPFANGESPERSWELTPHPAPVPAEFADRGRTCLRLELRNAEPVALKNYIYADTTQNWYRVLDPRKTYVVEFWARATPGTGTPDGTPEITFFLTGPLAGEVKPLPFALQSEWTRHRATFTVPRLLAKSGSVGQMCLRFQGPATIWFDNYRVYEEGTDFLDFGDRDYAALADSSLEALRTHSHIKTPWGYSMDMLTGPAGAGGYTGTRSLSPHTIDSWFRIFAKAKVNPWVQIEMCMDEDEWLGFVEYIAAPYDPAVDTPEKKPWAFKRCSQGRREPWITAFDKLYFEISNETWNPLFRPWIFNWLKMTDEATGQVYQSGEIYGLFQQYVIDLMKSSPHWSPDLDDKFEAVIGGWAIQTGDNGYGQQAARTSPATRHLTVAAYNGGWDEKEPPADATDEFYFKALAQTAQVAIPRADEMVAWLAAHDAEHGGDRLLGTYEAGPGYNLNGLNNVRMTPEQTEAESLVMKSLAGGTATLDSFLARGERGFALQNFFTFSRQRHHWSSHARWTSGGQAYPAWKALSLYNREGVGDFLRVTPESVPTVDLPPKGRRKAVGNAPLVAVYATRREGRTQVFVLSRKIDEHPVAGDDGFIPVTLRLPFATVKSVTLHRMAGPPRAHNLDADQVGIETIQISAAAYNPDFAINENTGADPRGLPPASTLLYVFEN